MAEQVNEAMRVTWNAESGDNWVRRQQQLDELLAPWWTVVAEAIDLRPDERVLDIGCGNGATTRAAARTVGRGGRVVGVDVSVPMLAHARSMAAADGIGNVHFVEGDCQVASLAHDGGPYDAAVSRFGVMFFDDPVAAFANVARSLRPGGRLAIVSWAPMSQQEWLTVPFAALAQHLGPSACAAPAAGPGMFGLSDATAIRHILGRSGWAEVSVRAERRRMTVAGASQGAVDAAVGLVLSSGPGRAAVAGAAPAIIDVAVSAVRAALAERLTEHGVELDGTAYLTTAVVPQPA
jgi:SAM-dependent methyltransferase